MKKVYANLLGTWTDITEEGTIHGTNSLNYANEEIQDMFKYDYVNVVYKDKNYRIHPSLIQVVTE